MLPAEIWRRNAHRVTHLIIRDRKIASIALDEAHEIADADRQNNYFPRRIVQSRLEAFKRKDRTRNLMRDMRKDLKSEQADGWRIPFRRPDDEEAGQ